MIRPADPTGVGDSISVPQWQHDYNHVVTVAALIPAFKFKKFKLIIYHGCSQRNGQVWVNRATKLVAQEGRLEEPAHPREA